MGGRDPAGGYSFPNRFEGAFIDEMKYFRDVVEAGKNATHLPPKSPPRDDIATSKLIAALEMSYFTKRPIYLDKNIKPKDINIPLRVGISGEGAYGNYLKSIIDRREKYETGLVMGKFFLSVKLKF